MKLKYLPLVPLITGYAHGWGYVLLDGKAEQFCCTIAWVSTAVALTFFFLAGASGAYDRP